MSKLKMKIGPKGQVVIPGAYRKKLNLMPGTEVVFEQEGEYLILEKPSQKIEEVAEQIAFAGDSFARFSPHESYQEEIKKRVGKNGIS